MDPSDQKDRAARIKRTEDIKAFHWKHGMGRGESEKEILMRSLNNRCDYMKEVLEAMDSEVDTFRELVTRLGRLGGLECPDAPTATP